MNLIDRINDFEAGPETVNSFNLIFTNCPLRSFNPYEIVTIGEIDGPETTRLLTVGQETFRHNFAMTESDFDATCQENEEEENDS